MSAPSAWARATAVVSEPPRPRKVTSRSVDTPCEPATTGTWPRSMASRMRSARTSRILALVWVVSVMKPAWLPVNDSASTPMSCSAMHSSAVALRSPAVISMSISRPGRVSLTSDGQAQQLVGLLAHGADDDDDVVAPALGARDVIGHRPHAIGVGDRGATELLDDESHGRGGYPEHPGARSRSVADG